MTVDSALDWPGTGRDWLLFPGDDLIADRGATVGAGNEGASQILALLFSTASKMAAISFAELLWLLLSKLSLADHTKQRQCEFTADRKEELRLAILTILLVPEV